MPSIAAKLTITALALLAGCQSSGDSASTAAGTTSAAPNAVACDKCATTWVRTSTYSGHRGAGSVVGYSRTSSKPCEECRQVATEWITSKGATRPATVAHQCKTCGGNLSVCKVHGT